KTSSDDYGRNTRSTNIPYFALGPHPQRPPALARSLAPVDRRDYPLSFTLFSPPHHARSESGGRVCGHAPSTSSSRTRCRTDPLPWAGLRAPTPLASGGRESPPSIAAPA